MVHRIVKEVELQAQTALRWHPDKMARRSSKGAGASTEVQPRPQTSIAAAQANENKMQYAQAALDRDKRGAAAIVIQKRVRAYLVRAANIRSGQAALTKLLAETRVEGRQMILGLEDQLISDQARLAWAFDADKVVTITVKRESKTQSLGVDVEVPKQVVLQYRNIERGVTFSEPYLQVVGFKVSCCLLPRNKPARFSVARSILTVCGCLAGWLFRRGRRIGSE